MNRFAAFTLSLAAAALLSACVFTPPAGTRIDANDIAKMSDQALATCGAGNVKEVNAKSFSCK